MPETTSGDKPIFDAFRAADMDEGLALGHSGCAKWPGTTCRSNSAPGAGCVARQRAALPRSAAGQRSGVGLAWSPRRMLMPDVPTDPDG